MGQWHDLTDLTGDRPFVVTGVRLQGSDISIAGEFELPPWRVCVTKTGVRR